MTNGWTGGQYSVYRFLLGAVLAVGVAWLAHGLEMWAGLGLAWCLALGLGDRFASLFAIALLAYVHGTAPASASVLVLQILLLAHACTPAGPYGSFAARGRSDPGGGWRMPRWHPFFALTPGWLPPRRDAEPATLFYDGDCGLCHRAVRFVLAEDPDGRAFRFAPLASEAFLAALPAAERAALPDSLIVRTPSGRVVVRTAAVREICIRLGGLWRALALASHALPESLLDRGYDQIARTRKRFFARPAEACPLVPADLRRRFD